MLLLDGWEHSYLPRMVNVEDWLWKYRNQEKKEREEQVCLIETAEFGKLPFYGKLYK